MANEEHLRILSQGVKAWNQWRRKNPDIKPNLIGAYLCKSILREADLREVNLRESNISWANLYGADLSEANLTRSILVESCLSKSNLYRADLRGANLSKAELLWSNLTDTNLCGANLHRAILTSAWLDGANLSHTILSQAWLNGARLAETNLSEAMLSNARLERSLLIKTNLTGADLRGCSIYGLSAWDLNLNEDTKQTGLIITPNNEPVVTVDNLEVAQFIYLLLNRRKLRNVLDTVISKAVLILGRFTPERRAILDAMADKLRKNNLLPIIFDFERSSNRDFTETIKILAGLSLFVIVDLTKPRSAPQELTATVPDYQIPFVPILEEGEDPYSMFKDLKKYDWVLKPVLKYRTQKELLTNFKEVILERAWRKHLELQRKKNEELEMVSIDQIIESKE